MDHQVEIDLKKEMQKMRKRRKRDFVLLSVFKIPLILFLREFRFHAYKVL